MTKKIIMTALIIYLGLCIQFSPRSYGRSISGRIVSNVSLNSKIFNPTKGEDMEIKYKLSKKSRVKTGIYDPAGRLIRVIASEDMQDIGYSTLVWDGRDEMGNIVPDEAYTYAVFTWDKVRKTSVYYPVESKGEALTLMDSSLDGETGQIEYVLPNAGRVRIRIGINNGPLLLTLLDWAPRQAGKNHEKWDGKDSAGLRDLLGDKQLTAVVSVFSLPMNSVITEGNRSPIHPLQRYGERIGVDGKDGGGGNKYENVSPVKTGIHNSITASEEMLRKANPEMLIDHDRSVVGGYSSHGHHKREECMEPGFSVTFSGEKAGAGIPVLKGVVLVKSELSELDKGRLIANRFEVKLYVDDLFIFEEEQGLSPYTYRWNTRGISKGNHILTVNVIEAGGMDHIGTKSLMVKIDR